MKGNIFRGIFWKFKKKKIKERIIFNFRLDFVGRRKIGILKWGFL